MIAFAENTAKNADTVFIDSEFTGRTVIGWAIEVHSVIYVVGAKFDETDRDEWAATDIPEARDIAETMSIGQLSDYEAWNIDRAVQMLQHGWEQKVLDTHAASAGF